MPELEIMTKIIISAILGGLVGLERTVALKHAGMRTFALVSMGATLFVVVAQVVALQYAGFMNVDVMRALAAVVSGIGFLGAGMILMQKDSLHGLTTAAGLWTTAGIGAAVGFGMYYIAVFAVLIVLLLFTGMWYIEEYIRRVLKCK